MNKILSDIAQATEFQRQQAGAFLIFNDLPPCLGDSQQIDQVFSNLIHNAIKYRHPSRQCEIVITGWKDETLNQSVYCIEDNGLGIRQEHHEQIFEIFHRLDPNSSSGEGLGLTISQRIIERHQGKIWLESTLNQGAKFFVSLPNSLEPPPAHD